MLEEGTGARIYIWHVANFVWTFVAAFAGNFAGAFAGDFAGDFSGDFVGNEAICVVKFGKQKARGKALLETSEVLFRSEDAALRLKLPFADLKSASASEGELRLETADGPAIFQLGANAAKWCEKILHPKTRLEKLGVKPNAAVSLAGNVATDFLAELRAQTTNV